MAATVGRQPYGNSYPGKTWGKCQTGTDYLSDRGWCDAGILDAAKRYFDSKGLKKLPSYKALQAQIEQLIKEKNALYNEYHEAKDKDKELGTVRHNIDQILNGELSRKQEQEI